MEIASRSRLSHRLSGFLPVSLLSTLGRWWRCRREREELLAMDHRALRDIGITRVDAVAEARKPFWRE